MDGLLCSSMCLLIFFYTSNSYSLFLPLGDCNKESSVGVRHPLARSLPVANPIISREDIMHTESYNKAADLGLLALRLTSGGLMAGHGAQKLFGSFGGHG